MNAAVDIVSLSPRVKSFIGQPRQALIDGRWQSARDEETFEVFNPATEEVIAHVADCKKADVDLAVAAARKAFDLIVSGRFRCSDTITSHAPLSELNRVFRQLMNRAGDIKTAIIP